MSRAMMYSEGVFGSRPSAATAGNGGVYFATDTGNLYRSNGTTWTLIGSTGGSGIDFDQANTGGFLNVETTSQDAGGGAIGIRLHDTGASSSGLLIDSDSGDVTIQASDATHSVFLQTGALHTALSLISTGVERYLPAGGSDTVYDSAFAAILVTDEATGVTTGTFDGGSP